MAQTVTLAIGQNGKETSRVEVPAKVFGVWAVHRPYHSGSGDDLVLGDTSWTITHAPTGLNTLLHTRLRATAWDCAKEMASTLPAYQTREEIDREPHRALGVLQKHGLKRYC